MMRRTSS